MDLQTGSLTMLLICICQLSGCHHFEDLLGPIDAEEPHQLSFALRLHPVRFLRSAAEFC